MYPIIITDDSQDDVTLAERTFRECKILNPVSSFSSGAELLAYFRGDYTVPVLVLLDMVMAPLGGADVLKELRKRGITEESAIVMLSGLPEYKVLQEGYQLGARTFLVKPLKREDILQLLSN